MSFSLEKDMPVFIYGASKMGIEIGRRLREEGFTVTGFIDRNAKALGRIDEIPVYTIQTLPPVDKGNEAVILILLQNAMQHSDIARDLFKAHYHKIIFCPVRSFRMIPEKVSVMRRIFNDCIRIQLDQLRDIPEYGEIIRGEPDYQGGGIVGFGRFSFWAPAELCYAVEKGSPGTMRSADYTDDAKRLTDLQICGKNLYCLKPYWDLFSYLRGEREDCGLYLKVFGKESHINYKMHDDSKLLKDRNELFLMYAQHLNTGMDFFMESPAEIRIGKSGKIIILDGIHRSIFLLLSGCRWIPARCSREEYEKLGNQTVLKRLIQVLEQKKTDYLKYPIEHPAFFEYPVQRCDLLRLWATLTDSLYSEKIKVDSILDLSLTGSWFARNFVRMGAVRGACLAEPEDEEVPMVNELFGMGEIETAQSPDKFYEDSFCYDFVIICGRALLQNTGKLFRLPEITRKGICVMDVPAVKNERVCELLGRIFPDMAIRKICSYTVEGLSTAAFLLTGK